MGWGRLAAHAIIDTRMDNGMNDMIPQGLNRSPAPGMLGPLQRRRVAMWLMLAVMATLVGWFGVRGYLNPDLLFHFANALYC